jgi:Flp pilus assembly secretin CpaC
LAQGFDIAPFHILPEDVIPDSVRLVRFNTNIFAVRWTYTETGAQKLLTFNEAHAGQRAFTVVGDYETRPFEVRFAPTPTFTNYAAWKAGWLQHRTDKFFGLNETEATAIADALRYGYPKFRCLSLTNPSVKPAGNVTLGSVKGILTDPNFRMVIHALEQRSGFETLAEPEVVTTSGRGQNSIRIQNLVWNITVPVTNLPAASAK